jgi:hypothetical protein
LACITQPDWPKQLQGRLTLTGVLLRAFGTFLENAVKMRGIRLRDTRAVSSLQRLARRIAKS